MLDMTYSKMGERLTEGFEGCRLTAYQDSGGVWTIGYGHTAGVYAGKTCTEAQAEAWLGGEVRAESGSGACFIESQARHDRRSGVARHGWILA